MERCNLLLIKATDDVPDDGNYYLYHKEKLVGKYMSLAAAQNAFDEIEKQYPPPKIDETPAKMVDILKNQLRTVSNNALLKGKRAPYRNPK